MPVCCTHGPEVLVATRWWNLLESFIPACINPSPRMWVQLPLCIDFPGPEVVLMGIQSASYWSKQIRKVGGVNWGGLREC